MGLKTFGLQGVDWEERVNYERRGIAAAARCPCRCFIVWGVTVAEEVHKGDWHGAKCADYRPWLFSLASRPSIAVYIPGMPM